LLSDKLAVFIQGSSTSNEYRVTKDKHIARSFFAGGMFDRSIEYRQESLGKVVVKNVFCAGLRLIMVIYFYLIL